MLLMVVWDGFDFEAMVLLDMVVIDFCWWQWQWI